MMKHWGRSGRAGTSALLLLLLLGVPGGVRDRHHPYSLKDPAPIVEFVLEHACVR